MIGKEQFQDMLALQNTLNACVDPLWVESNHPWHRAILVEAVEALDHHGWKWWRDRPATDLAQLQLELVDIWHFAMSLVLQRQSGDPAQAANVLHEFFSSCANDPLVTVAVQSNTVEELLELVAAAAAAHHQFHGPAFCVLMARVNLTWERLHEMYVAKNVLNLFRQDHGYKDGTYRKTWGEVEDNVVLANLMREMPGAEPNVLYRELSEIYNALQ